MKIRYHSRLWRLVGRLLVRLGCDECDMEEWVEEFSLPVPRSVDRDAMLDPLTYASIQRLVPMLKEELIFQSFADAPPSSPKTVKWNLPEREK